MLPLDIVAKLHECTNTDFIGTRDLWFSRLSLSSKAVIAGLILEGPELAYEMRTLARKIKRFRYSIVIPENRVEIAKTFAFVGWVFIVVGLWGELKAGAKIEDLSAHIQGCNEARLAEVTENAGTAKNSAKESEAASTKAKEDSAKAVSSASNAMALASGARQEADSFENDITSAKTQAAEAESHLADALQRAAKAEAELNRLKTPRSLVHSEELIAALKPFSDSEYTLNVFMDDESIQFTKAVAVALKAAGWVRKQPASISFGIPTVEIVFDQGVAEHVPACLATGISLNAHAKESLAVLRALPSQSLPKTVQAAGVLNSAIARSISPPDERNVVTGVLDPKPAEGIPMTICVGKKP
jgi:hypothetical protein